MTGPGATQLSCREELAVILVLSAGDPLDRDRSGPTGEQERRFIGTLAEIEWNLIEHEWAALERLLPYLGEGAPKVEDEAVRARLIDAIIVLGWHLPASEGRS